jgi:hypothetical protein
MSGNSVVEQISADLIGGSSVVWDDLRLVPSSFDYPGNNDPTIVDYQPAGSGTTFKVWKFDKDDAGYASVQMPHSYKEGSDLHFHIHWTSCNRGTTEGTAKVGWKVDYSIANVHGNFVASQTVDLSDACSGVNHRHEITNSVAVSGTGLSISHIILLKIYRSDTGADDTWAGTGSNAPALLEFDIHYQIDALGSKQEVSK